MAKNGLHINEENLVTCVGRYTGAKKNNGIIDKSCLNSTNQHYRYQIEKDGKTLFLDVFFNKNRTLTLMAHGTGTLRVLSEELVEYIKENVEYKNVISGTFNCPLDAHNFDMLKKYLCELEGVSLTDEKDNGDNGYKLQFLSEIGDRITLTYYKTKAKLRFQGYLMKLHVEVKCFLSAYTYVKTDVENSKTENESKIITDCISRYLSNSYSRLDKLLQDLLYDSIAQTVYKCSYNDYSVWTFPALKALEGRIKQIFYFNDIRINDKWGFVIRTDKAKSPSPIFIHESSIPMYKIDKDLVSIKDDKNIQILERCYNYFNKNRHGLFHTKQILKATRTVNTQEEAISIIYEVCGLIEESYNILGE